MPRILIVEDDPGVREVLEHTLSREGMEVESLEDGEKALERMQSVEALDLVILDLTLPGLDGVSVCRELRADDGPNKEVPVIMLTARDDETSAVVGLEVGADDYITKPFRSRELVSRIRAQLRRRRFYSRADGGGNEQKLEFPGLEVDLIRRRVFSDGNPVDLTAAQFEVLSLLASHPGRVYTREQIMAHLWNGDFFGEPRAADVHIQHIRKKIEPDLGNPRYIVTLRGVGYRFAEG